MNPITDINQRLLGYTSTTPNGRQNLYDSHLRWLGYYEPSTDLSFDRNLHCLGRGNQTMRLLAC